MAVPTLSKEAEQRIIRAAGDTVDLVLGGMDPTDAVVKAATDLNLPQGHSRLVARAYNVAKTNQQRESGTSILEKTAEFALADGDAAEARLFPKSFKKAACTDVSVDYLLPPTFLTKRREELGFAERTKAASEILAAEQKPATIGSTSYVSNKTASLIEEQTRVQFEKARAESSAAFDKLASLFSDLQSFFQTTKQADYVDTVGHAALMCNQSSLLALALIRPCLSDTVKQAKESSAMHSQRQAQYVLLSAIRDASQDWATKRQTMNDKRASLADKLPKMEARKLVSESILGDMTVKSANEFVSSMIGNLTGATAGQKIKEIGEQSPLFNNEHAYNSAVDTIHDPDHEATLKNIRTQAMLHSLMLHDPVIKGHAPHEVLNAFNELSETAPRLSDQVLIMQPLLRKRLTQGVMDPFEVSQIMQMDKQQGQRPAAGGSGSIM